MILSVITGFIIDLIIGDPHGFPHPVIAIGKLIALLEKLFRKLFPKTKRGEEFAGFAIWLVTVTICFLIPFGILKACDLVSPWLRFGVESIMCWTIIATKSLKKEAMKVYRKVKDGSIEEARYAVSMIVGRDTERLDMTGVTKATVETVAENTSDGIIAPLIFMIIGGAPLGFLYKGVNTMDSMLGYVEEPYKNVGMFPAKADDVFNFLPARFSAVMMLLAGASMGLSLKQGWRIFKRDRYNHASPNSAQTESVCAGLLGVRLAGDAWYHGVLHRKKFIGDDVRPIVPDDIPLSCRLLYVTAIFTLIFLIVIRFSLTWIWIRDILQASMFYLF